jgi:hypothetical protein
MEKITKEFALLLQLKKLPIVINHIIGENLLYLVTLALLV